jgi:hypothetical protein
MNQPGDDMVGPGLQLVTFYSNYYNDPDKEPQAEIILNKEGERGNEAGERRYKVQGTRYKAQGTRNKEQGTRNKKQGTSLAIRKLL